MCVSLRQQINAMGIDGMECEQLINEYHALTKMKGTDGVTIGIFLQQVKESRKG